MTHAPPTGNMITRFAPSPTGYLHLGHAHAALFADRRAREAGGRFLLRIEDVDAARCRDDYDAAIFTDLAWLGLDWETPVMRQSQRHAAYQAALARLDALGVLYPCFCTRKEIRAEVARAGAAPHGPTGAPYPGTCRHLSAAEREAHMAAGRAAALRLDQAKAHALVGYPSWHDRAYETATADLSTQGDVVLARKEIGTSYHLSVTVDDAAQGITLVTRGADLLESTPVHRVLQALLGLPVPDWHHHELLTDETGQRLAKRDDARSIASLRTAGATPAEVRALAGFPGTPQ